MSRMTRSFSTGCVIVAMSPFALFGGYSISSKILNIGRCIATAMVADQQTLRAALPRPTLRGRGRCASSGRGRVPGMPSGTRSEARRHDLQHPGALVAVELEIRPVGGRGAARGDAAPDPDLRVQRRRLLDRAPALPR